MGSLLIFGVVLLVAKRDGDCVGSDGPIECMRWDQAMISVGKTNVVDGE